MAGGSIAALMPVVVAICTAWLWGVYGIVRGRCAVCRRQSISRVLIPAKTASRLLWWSAAPSWSRCRFQGFHRCFGRRRRRGYGRYSCFLNRSRCRLWGFRLCLGVSQMHSCAIVLTYRLLSCVQHVLCACWLLRYVLAHALSLAVLSLVDSSRLHRAVFVSVQMPLCYRPLTQ